MAEDEQDAQPLADASNTPVPPGVPPAEKTLIVSRENGSGEREITASAFSGFMERTEGAFIVRETQVVAPHHSDSF